MQVRKDLNMQPHPEAAIVLAGGLGTRLRASFPDVPKPLVPVAGRPFLLWLLDWLRSQDVKRIHLAAGYKAQQIVEWARRQDVADVTLTVSSEPDPLGTAGGLRYAAVNVDGSRFLVLNGDSFLPALSIATLLQRHGTGGHAATLAVTRVSSAGRYGTVEFDEDGRLLAFREKADRAEGWVNGGVYVVSREILQRIPLQGPSSLETDIFPVLAKEGRIGVLETPPPLLDMGTPDGLRALEAYIDAHGG